MRESIEPIAPVLNRIVQLMAGFELPWAFCGGWAIDLFLGRVARPHKDVDVAILRRDQLALQEHLDSTGWSCQIAHGGALQPWSEGSFIEHPRHSVWCRNPRHDPEFLEVLLNEGSDGRFLFRRDRLLTRDLAHVFLRSWVGLPFLAPEVVLLYKSGDAKQSEAEADFRAALPALDPEQRGWLGAALGQFSPAHPWLEVI